MTPQVRAIENRHMDEKKNKDAPGERDQMTTKEEKSEKTRKEMKKCKEK